MLAVIGGVVLLVIIVVVVLIVATSSSGGVNYNTLRTGNCFNRTTGPKEDKVACTALHQVEVTGTFQATAGPYPGEAGLRPQAVAECGTLATEYLGSHPSDGLEIVWLVPAKGTWDDGIRAVICGVQNIDGSKRAGSIAG
ncbi:MAG: septum formation family protein [Acidimicrobiales bacterium]